MQDQGCEDFSLLTGPFPTLYPSKQTISTTLSKDYSGLFLQIIIPEQTSVNDSLVVDIVRIVPF